MTILERTEQLPQRVLTPFERFAQASTKEKRILGREVVTYATEQRVDASALVACISLAINCKVSPDKDNQRTGDAMLQQIQRYLQKRPILHKSVLPSYADQLGSLSFMNHEMDSLQNTLAQDTADIIPPGIKVHIEYINDILRNTNAYYRSTGEVINNVVPFINMQFREDEQESFKEYYYHDKVFELCKKQNETKMSTVDTLRIPEQLVELLSAIDQKKDNPFPSVFSERFHGVSLKDVISEEDPISYSEKLLDLMDAVPRGDFFWKTLMHNIAFPYPFRTVDYPDPDVFFTDPTLSRKLFSFQWWFTQKMLMPVFDEAYKDKDFDEQVRSLLVNQDDLQNSLLALVTSVNIQYFPWVHTLRDARFSLESDNSTPCPVVSEAIPDGSFQLARQNEQLFSFILTDFLGKNKEKILINLRQRFPGGESMHTKLETLILETNEIAKNESKEWDEAIQEIYTENSGETVDHKSIHQWDTDVSESSVVGGWFFASTFTPDSFPQKFAIDRFGMSKNATAVSILLQSTVKNYCIFLTYDNRARNVSIYPAFPDDSPLTLIFSELGKSIISRLIPETKEKEKITPVRANAIFLNSLNDPA